MGAVENGTAPDAVPRAAVGSSPVLSLVVPAFNESDRLAEGVERLRRAVSAGAIDARSTELLLVDDGSTDNTAELARRLLAPMPWARVIRMPKNAGKGAAVRVGVTAARGAAVAFTDADMAIDPVQMPRFLEALAGADLAIGSRLLPGASADGGDTLHRRLMGHVFNLAARRVTGLPLGDTQCGFKAFRTPAARLLFHFGTVDRFAFDVELLQLANRLGMTVRQVPVRWRHAGRSRIRLADPALMLADVARIGRSAGGPPVEALELGPAGGSGPGSAATARRLAGPTLPVVALPEGGALVLLPLCSAEDVRRVSARLGAELRSTSCVRRSLTVGQLAELHPTGLAGPPPVVAQPMVIGDGPAANGSAPGTADRKRPLPERDTPTVPEA